MLLHVEWRHDSEIIRNWRMWRRAAGLGDIDPERGPRVSMETMVMQAAIEGQDVALACSALVQDDISRGRLIVPFAETESKRTRFCNYVVYPEHFATKPKVKAFRDRVMREANAAEDR